jgi:hypothetical protein
MTQALNWAAACGGAAVNNKAQGLSQKRILRHSFLRAPDWTMFVPPLNRPRFRLCQLEHLSHHAATLIGGKRSLVGKVRVTCDPPMVFALQRCVAAPSHGYHERSNDVKETFDRLYRLKADGTIETAAGSIGTW